MAGRVVPHGKNTPKATLGKHDRFLVCIKLLVPSSRVCRTVIASPTFSLNDDHVSGCVRDRSSGHRMCLLIVLRGIETPDVFSSPSPDSPALAWCSVALHDYTD